MTLALKLNTLPLSRTSFCWVSFTWASLCPPTMRGSTLRKPKDQHVKLFFDPKLSTSHGPGIGVALKAGNGRGRLAANDPTTSRFRLRLAQDATHSLNILSSLVASPQIKMSQTSGNLVSNGSQKQTNRCFEVQTLRQHSNHKPTAKQASDTETYEIHRAAQSNSHRTSEPS